MAPTVTYVIWTKVNSGSGSMDRVRKVMYSRHLQVQHTYTEYSMIEQDPAQLRHSIAAISFIFKRLDLA